MEKIFTSKKTKLFFLIAGLLLTLQAISAQKHIVEVSSNKFEPKDLSVSVGDTVEWRNIQGWHNVNGTQTTYPGNPESFGNSTGSGWTYSFVFTKEGKYDYQCDPHVGLGMVGTVTVTGNSSMKYIVEVSNNVFTPDELTISVGDTVEWRNIQGWHNVNGTQTTYPGNPESFGNSTGSGWTYSFVFTKEGKYDYQCDPHVGLGMTGKIEVKPKNDDSGKNILTIQFSGMDPHNGQLLYLSVYEKDSGREVERKVEDIHESFSVQVSGIETGHSYIIDFFADHNANGMYDAPPTDHAWRLELNNVMGDTTLNFAHNTNFTDIMWKNKLMVNFTGMNPHDGQNLSLRVVEKNSGKVVYETKIVASPEFSISAYGIEKGMSYNVDFFADHNGNGMYDAPPADHAWRMELNNVAGDTTLNFAHNTNFTDIMWKNKLIVNFTGMNPHDGQNISLRVVEKNSGTVVYETKIVASPEFSISSYGIEKGMSYNVDFFADHNGNGMYDAPPADHAWRMELNNVAGDTTLNFAHNTNFTDISISTNVDLVEELPFSAYPNPAHSTVRVEFSGFGPEVKVALFDINGKIRQITSAKSGELLEIDIRHLPSGVYLLRLEGTRKHATHRLIKK